MKTLTLKRPSRPIAASIPISGSKSYTNRALVMAALASGTSTLTSCSPSRDCEALIAALQRFGVMIETPDSATIIVKGTRGHLVPYQGTIDVGPAGTTMRFLTALCAGIPGADIILRGSERMHERPIGSLVETLREAGACIEYMGREGCPPLRIHSTKELQGNDLHIDGTTSSQFLSAILLASPLFKGGIDLSVVGTQVSTSYVDMTLQGMREFGISPECKGYTSFRVPAEQKYTARTYCVEGDASGASYLWAIAAVSGGSVTVENINPHSAQGDIEFPKLLERMGCVVTHTHNSITVSGPRTLLAIDADMELMPDTAQTLAVVAAFARGDTTIRGLQTLRGKETDRIDAVHRELLKIGITSTPGADYLIVHGGAPHGGRISTYEDHRMAMSFAVCSAAIDGMIIEEPHVVEKSFPNFWDVLTQLGCLCVE